MPIFERGAVRLHFQEAGNGFPLLIIPGGGLNSTIAGLTDGSHPFDPMTEFRDEYRCIFADLRTANAGKTSPGLVCTGLACKVGAAAHPAS